ncbi:MAG: hypothetical protein V7742_21170 [Halioglobus sp.]
MNDVEVVELLHQLQLGKLLTEEKSAIRLQLKQAAVSFMRQSQALPLALGWYVALMLEDHKPKDNLFIQVKDKGHIPESATKGTFAVAWAHDYLSNLTDQQRRTKYKGVDDIGLILEENFPVSEEHIQDARDTYGGLVQLLNNRQFTPESISPYFARYAISHTYIDSGVEPEDIWLVMQLKDGTLLQCFRDGNFRAFTPNKTYEIERIRYDSATEHPMDYTDKSSPITRR